VRRVYAAVSNYAMENKVPKPVNPALRKAFVQPAIARFRNFYLKTMQESAHSREEPATLPLRFFVAFLNSQNHSQNHIDRGKLRVQSSKWRSRPRKNKARKNKTRKTRAESKTDVIPNWAERPVRAALSLPKGTCFPSPSQLRCLSGENRTKTKNYGRPTPPLLALGRSAKSPPSLSS
jgi:hypothetical protein